MAAPGRGRAWAALAVVAALGSSGCTSVGPGGSPTPAIAPPPTPTVAPTATVAPERGSLVTNGRTRTYLLHVPPELSSPRALVIDLHGGGGLAEGQQRIGGYDDVADANGFIVVRPQGVDRSWADGRGTTPADRSGVDDVGFISELIDTLVGEYGIDPRWVFATGLSNGAFMANRLGCDLSGKIAAIAPVAGTLGAEVQCSADLPVAVMSVHGTDDPLVPYDGGQMRGRGGSSTILSVSQLSDLWRTIDGCQQDGTEQTLPGTDEGMAVTTTSWVGCDRGTSVVRTTVTGGGHTWPGGEQYLPESVIGRTTKQFAASAASWEFFRTHPRR